MDPAPFWGRTPFACGYGGHRCCLLAYRPSPALENCKVEAGGHRCPLPGLLPMASLVTGPQRKETGQIHPFPPLHPSLRATLQEISVALAHSAWSRGRGVLSEGPSFSLSMCIFLDRTHT